MRKNVAVLDLLFVAEATRIHKNVTKKVRATALKNMKDWVAKKAEEIPFEEFEEEEHPEYIVLANAAAVSAEMSNVYG